MEQQRGEALERSERPGAGSPCAEPSRDEARTEGRQEVKSESSVPLVQRLGGVGRCVGLEGRTRSNRAVALERWSGGGLGRRAKVEASAGGGCGRRSSKRKRGREKEKQGSSAKSIRPLPSRPPLPGTAGQLPPPAASAAVTVPVPALRPGSELRRGNRPPLQRPLPSSSPAPPPATSSERAR